MLMLFDGERGFQDTVQFLEEQGGAGLWRWDLRTGKMQWSSGFFRLLGLDDESVTPTFEYLQAVTHPDDVRPPGEMDALIANGGPVRREFRIIQPNGRVRRLLSRAEVLLDKSGTAAQFVGVIFDVTEQHAIRTRVEALKTQLSSLMELLGAATWCASPDGKGIEMTGWCRLTGQSPSEAIGLGWMQAVHPEDRAAVAQTWSEAVRHAVRYQKDYRLLTGGTEYRMVRARAVPVRGKDGKILEWVGITVPLHSELELHARSGQKLTGAQLRAARALLNWSVKELADNAGVSPSTIRRLEETDAAPKSDEPAIPLLQSALEQRGVSFLFPSNGPPLVGLNRVRKI